MSGGEDDEVYSDTPSNSIVSDMRLKIAMFEKPGGKSATKQKLTPQLTRNGVGPKPPGTLPPKQQALEKGAPPVALPPKTRKLPPRPNEKPSPEPVALPPRNRKDEGASAAKGAPPAVRSSIFHHVERNRNEPATNPRQSSASPANLNEKETLYPPDKRTSKCEKTSKLPPWPAQNNGLFKMNGEAYRKLPFVAPKGPAPTKPQKPPVQTTTFRSNRAEVEEIYEDASEYEQKRNNETHKTGGNDEEYYEEVDAYSEVFRK